MNSGGTQIFRPQQRGYQVDFYMAQEDLMDIMDGNYNPKEGWLCSTLL